MQDIISAIRAAHRERCFAMEQRKRADLSLLSFLRTQAGWRLDLPEKERKAIAERAKAFADGGEDEGLVQWRPVVEASIGARTPFESVEKAALKRMVEAAEQLPVWEAFGEAIRGFGPASLAGIVGEAGDLSIYSNPAKLWKRMGLAVMGDVRQGGLAKNASKKDWIAHGYNRQRRSRMWNIGEALLKKDNEYRDLYLIRLAYEHAKATSAGLTPASTNKATIESWKERDLPPLEKVTKLTDSHRGAGHMANRARRYIEKRLLRDLWSAWRQTTRATKPEPALSAASHADQQAGQAMKPTDGLPADATGHSRNAIQKVDAGRSPSNPEATVDSSPIHEMPRKRRAVSTLKPVVATPGAEPFRETSTPAQPTAELSPKRRATVLATSNQGTPGAPIQQANVEAKPTSRVSADARGRIERETLSDVAPRKVSRANGTGDRHGRPETPNGTAITR